MGRIGAPWGVQGWSRVQTFTAEADTLCDFRTWWVGGPEGWQPRDVHAVEMKGDLLVAQLKGIADREAAMALTGCQVGLPRNALPPAGEGEYYWADLIGLDVVNLQGEVLGRVDRLFETAANDVIVVSGERERLIPFVDQYVQSVDLDARRLVVDWGKDY